jgi:hypothetical protein
LKHNPFDARCVFVDGPVAVFVHEAAQQDILDSYARIARYVAVAAEQLDTGKQDGKTETGDRVV